MGGGGGGRRGGQVPFLKFTWTCVCKQHGGEGHQSVWVSPPSADVAGWLLFFGTVSHTFIHLLFCYFTGTFIQRNSSIRPVQHHSTLRANCPWLHWTFNWSVPSVSHILQTIAYNLFLTYCIVLSRLSKSLQSQYTHWTHSWSDEPFVLITCASAVKPNVKEYYGRLF